jgi:hypothetical protein
VTFRVCSPAGEWLARAAGLTVVEGRVCEPKIENDRRLLEAVLSEAELAQLKVILARRNDGPTT